MSHRWLFYDPVEDETYTFEINPNDGGSPQFAKKITDQSTVAPGGKTLLFEGADEVQTLEFSGVILEQTQYDAFRLWWAKRRQIKVTDDLEREYWVYIKTFAPKRERAIHHPWKHSYSVTAVILDWP